LKGYEASHERGRTFGTITRVGGEPVHVEIPGLEITGIVGTGANGLVFSATDNLDRDLVVKIYPPRLDRLYEEYDSYEQAHEEALKVARLKHQSLSTLYRFGRLGEVDGRVPLWSPGWPFALMEYRAGRPLRQVRADLAEHPDIRMSVLRQVFEVLDYAERRYRVLHGDLHQGNVLVDVWSLRGRVSLMDVSVIDFGTSVFAGHPSSAKRHARMLREFAYDVVPELATVCLPTARLEGRVGEHMLPRLFAGLRLYGYASNCAPDASMSARLIGAELAYATDYDLTILWPKLRERLREDEVRVVRQACLEHLTHDHDNLREALPDEIIFERMRAEFDVRGIERQPMLTD
jgi:serine/threonine protein kinase